MSRPLGSLCVFQNLIQGLREEDALNPCFKRGRLGGVHALSHLVGELPEAQAELLQQKLAPLLTPPFRPNLISNGCHRFLSFLAKRAR